MKKRISLLLVLLLLVSALTPAALAADDADTTEAVPATPEQLAAEALSTIGAFRGTGNGSLDGTMIDLIRAPDIIEHISVRGKGVKFFYG